MGHETFSKRDYFYDARKRLTKAERFDTDGTTLLHRYSYTYDAGDNLVTKAVLDNGTSTTTTTVFAYNSANEQTSMTVGGTTTTQAYDAWGRLTGRAQGGYSATYAFPPAADLRRYGDKLYSVTSDFPGEGDVTYEYGGDQKRRSRVAGASETWYNWDAGWTVLSEEDNADGSSGALKRTYRGRNGAHVDGTNPATGAWKFPTHDSLGSSRSVWNADKTLYASFEQTPYGEVYASSGSTTNVTRRYTGHDWDETAEAYFAPFRYYQPASARWMTRDPAGNVDGPNVYAYVGGNPVMAVDSMGLSRGRPRNPEQEEEVEEHRRTYHRVRKACNLRIKSALKLIQTVLDLTAETVKSKRYLTGRSRNGEPIEGDEIEGVHFEWQEHMVVAGKEFEVFNWDSEISGRAGGVLGAHGKSLVRGRFKISINACREELQNTSLSPGFLWLVAHEAAHAARDFSRVKYVVTGIMNLDVYGRDPGTFAGSEETVADEFANYIVAALLVSP
ncbi:MAG: RHS repeat-associated core domain-containing protein [Candidatus Hydrogenedentes bacterium]|nr:RHS repeat-associated core domain-containing protein [Candidatus Hydrogenedentota bacterium]